MAAATYDDPGGIVDAVLDELGTELVVGTPLGIGKANHILNELVDRALDDPEIELSIWTALTLSKPEPGSELERRLLEPISERLFGEYQNLRYAELLDEQALPENIDVHQFYFPPGRHMDNPTAQQAHHSVNYTHALRAFRDAEPNLLLQLVGVGEYDGELHYNLGSNTDLSLDLIESMREARERGDRETMIVGEVSREMPFMYGDGPVAASTFDAVLDSETETTLFGPPNEAVSYADQAIGLRVSTLLRDGGTLQIGIGALGDAVGWATELRHSDNETYREVVDDLGPTPAETELIDELGGLGSFEEGLYGATEMFVQAFLELYEAGVLSREVYDDPTIQRLADEGVFDDVTVETLDRLLAEGAITADLDAEDVAYLKRWGIFTEDVSYDDGELRVAGESVAANLGTSQTRAVVSDHALGESLSGGRVLHGGFFMGSPIFYEQLRDLDPERRRQLAMTSVQFTNALYGDQQLKRRQRRHARFVNTGMKATVTGGIASDGTADGRVVSGVGGQFNFVNQAHELDGGRSIIMIRATRKDGTESNIVWNYGHITIPRHLRDIVVTEYGIADLRGKSDAEVIAEMIQIADSRFQADLIEQAKDAGKLPAEWELPEHARDNYPETIESALAPYRDRDVLPRFPYGSDLTVVERELARALQGLQARMVDDGLPDLSFAGLGKALLTPSGAEPYLERMGLASPSTPREFAYKRLVTLALAEEGII